MRLFRPVFQFFGHLFLLALLTSSIAFAQMKQYYQTHRLESGQVLYTASLTYEPLADDTLKVTWRSEGNNNHYEEYYLDDRYDTVRWHIFDENNGTDYWGQREGNRLHLRGTLEDEPLEKTVKIDGDPYYYNPTVNLALFAQTGEKRQKYWVLMREDYKPFKKRFDPVKLKATNRGTTPLTLGDETFDAVELRWQPNGIFGFSYYRTYWFRASDGRFLRSHEDEDQYTDWVERL